MYEETFVGEDRITRIISSSGQVELAAIAVAVCSASSQRIDGISVEWSSSDLLLKRISSR